MDKDFVTLRMLRYKFNNMLEPLPIKEQKTFDILNIPPYRKPKPSKDIVKIEEVTHGRDTKQAMHARHVVEEAKSVARIKEEVRNKLKNREKRILMEEKLPSLLGSLNPESFIVRSFH